MGKVIGWAFQGVLLVLTLFVIFWPIVFAVVGLLWLAEVLK